MDCGTDDAEFRRRGSFGQASSASSSLGRYSLSLSRPQLDNGIESETVSETGDIGDRALHNRRNSDSGSLRFSIDHASENGETIPFSELNLLQSLGFRSRDPAALNAVSVVTPLPEEIIFRPATPLHLSEDQKQEKEKVLPLSLEYISCLLHLAVFGILGTLTRYLLQKLFGPSIAHVTNELSILYLDLPSNMIGSFLMGWWGVVFKGDISKVSEFLAIGLTTGYLGSLTTFSGWNQKMLDLAVNGKWVHAFLGFFLGLFLVAYSIIFGIETANGFKWLLKRFYSSTNKEIPDLSSNCRVDSLKRHLAAMVILTLLLGVLWCVSGVLMKKEYDSDSSEAQLWLSCIVAPPGVWIRWFLARLNGRGLGRAGYLKWVPFGTLIANVSAALIVAALATVREAENNNTSNVVVGGIQFGFLGGLSTVSTFVAEFNAMRESNQPWRAYAYALATVLISFAIGIPMFCVPVWTRNFKF
ncbi:fluoride export protein 1-like isoform X1 [Mangifera indica]|uniref:fluoride export protein 1-like isoform X1 n=1 Tax=Mangifera indica TaxID=29780 RepID=UPI001CFACF89|nr:fluoride export protein 1-like isoform X1 [Mangifera indica]XP_044474813.1 fluoride export protein 1-like isoform X1 [Mangifera indica]